MKRITVLATIAAFSALAYPQALYSNQSGNPNIAALNAQAATRSGVAAGVGARWSEVQANGVGPQPESNTSAGFTASVTTTTSFRLADDFTVGSGGWNVTGFQTYGYNTGTASTFSPISGGTLNIWNGAPNVPTSTIIGSATFVNMDNDIVIDAAGTTANLHRVFCTDSPPPGTAPGTTRLIREVNWSASLFLAPGTYWIDFIYTPTTTGASIFVPSTTHQNTRGVAGANSLQWTGASWVSVLDTGNPTTAPDIAQDIPFIVRGTVVPEPGTMIALGAGAAALLARRRRKQA